MSQFGVANVPGPVGSLGSDGTKATPTASSTYQLAHTLVIAAAADEVVEITSVADGIGANNTLGTITITLGVSFQNEGEAEGGVQDVGTNNYGSSAIACTNNTFTQRSMSGSPVHRGKRGKDVTVRFYIKTSDPVTSSMCARDASVSGRRVRQADLVFGSQFGGVKW